MFPEVLIPTDLSETSATMVERIGEVPGVREVILFHALRGSTDLSPAGEEALNRMKETVQSQGCTARVVVEEVKTDIPARILQIARENNVDLIAIGVRDPGLFRNLFSGNIAATLLRDAVVDVLIMPQSARNGPPLWARLLVPTDLADPAPEIRTLLRDSGGVGGALLLNVMEPGRTEQEVADRLAAIRVELATPSREVEVLTRTGDPARTICAVAEEFEASMVVMPRIGRRDAAGAATLGSVTGAVATCVKRPLLVLAIPIHVQIETRELRSEEFRLAEEIWVDYHGLKADPKTDRIFGVFADGRLVSVARCRRHPDGYEVDGVFTPIRFRGRGYARRAMNALVEACQHDTLYMHAVRELVDFYGQYGFVSIPESDLPPTIWERYAFAMGEMEGVNVQPMRRPPVRFIQ
ncbi:GNAT family N-acetyltransferase [Methanoculleus sp.]|jgi:nucleotide-binding universal stress UspA family protein/GNAT superfamily N-acetyltransferase|uniref:GNAT family N-acetyltransferase n=1 Tax=Methanoculleus sp. TaxID=90427 RepID=UPI00345AA8BD